MEATTAVLETVELLERILLFLPFINIIRIQRVSLFWRDCVRNSPLLQQSLFRAPVYSSAAARVRKYSRYSVQPVTVNPLLQNLFRIRHSEISGSTITVVPPKDKRRLQQRMVSENVLKKSANSNGLDEIANRPLVLDSEQFYQQRNARSRRLFSPYDITNTVPFVLLNEDRQEQIHPRHIYRHDNWASMLATQPQIETLNLRCDSMGGRIGGIKVVAANGHGVTLRDLAEATADFYRPFPRLGTQGFCFDPEMSIYQPLRVDRPDNSDGTFFYSVRGRLRRAEKDEGIGFQRAWKTKLRCNLG